MRRLRAHRRRKRSRLRRLLLAKGAALLGGFLGWLGTSLLKSCERPALVAPPPKVQKQLYIDPAAEADNYRGDQIAAPPLETAHLLYFNGETVVYWRDV